MKAAREAVKPDSTKYDVLVSEILREHVDAVHVNSQERANKLAQDLIAECEELRHFLKAMSKSGEVTPEDEDRVISVGEKLSSHYLAALLEDYGVRAEYIDLSNVFNSKPSHGLNQELYRDLAQAIAQRVQKCGDKVPVITGFFGQIPGGLLNNCGRGYSDLCAALVAVGTEARELQIWKEVSGVYTAYEPIASVPFIYIWLMLHSDPRKVPTARLLNTIHPSEANELTFYGSEVIHHFTIEQCIPKIPIRIKNVLEPKAAGTIIFFEDNKEADPYQSLRPKRPTAVTVKQQITVVNVHSYRKVESPEFLAEICKILARWSLAVNLFELNECHVSLAVHSKTPFIKGAGAEDQEDLQTQHQDLQNAIRELKEYGAVEVKYNMAILSLIGLQLKKSIGIAGKMFTALGNNNINIEMISQGMPFRPVYG